LTVGLCLQGLQAISQLANHSVPSLQSSGKLCCEAITT